MNILVLGGTRFFGKLLVERLIREGHAVTLLTRGETSDQFAGNVQRIKCQRSDADGMRRCLEGKRFDAVYDQICFSPDDAAITCDIFNKAGVAKYIFTSSVYVYEGRDELLDEHDFKPEEHAIKMGPRELFSYAEGKRMAEVYFAHKATFPCVSVRFPIVMGRDDYTGRFAHYVSRILFAQNIYLPHPQGKMNFINARDAAGFLFWLKDVDFTGAINAASEASFNADELVEMFSKVLGKPPRIVARPEDSDETFYPYCKENNMIMAVARARSLGFEFSSFHEWFSREVEFVKEGLCAGRCR